uniref:Uncharacterized protein n=1 Tax=Pyrodinium bahamense TaxID=73915 RepID=A0A7S0FDX2_9DINO
MGAPLFGLRARRSQGARREAVPPPLVLVCAAAVGLVRLHCQCLRGFVPTPTASRAHGTRSKVASLPLASLRTSHAAVLKNGGAAQLSDAALEAQGSPLAAGLVGVLGGVAVAEGGFLPSQAAVERTSGTVLGSLLEHHGSWSEDLFLAAVLCITAYCLLEMNSIQMRCPHFEARVHTTCNFLAALCSLYGIAMERIFRESPDLWWAILTPLLYGMSNLTMTKLMAMYKGPQAYKRLFELGQSFTLSFQGIHLLAWSSVYPALYWAAMPFWYWSLKKLAEAVVYVFDLVSNEDAAQKEAHRGRSRTWGGFGLGMDALTIGFTAVNFAAALVDNAYMGVYTLRGPEGFFEVSRSLVGTAGWGSDHLRMALVKPALGSLVLSMAVFIGTLVSRRRLPLAVGVPIAAVLSALGPWLVFFWHRLVDSAEPWLPELLGPFSLMAS